MDARRISVHTLTQARNGLMEKHERADYLHTSDLIMAPVSACSTNSIC
jgi:hypothetical protein